MSPMAELPHHVIDGTLSIPCEADVDARPDAPDHASSADKVEVEVEDVEPYEEVTPSVEVSDQLPERAQDARLVKVEAPGSAVAPEHPSGDYFAVALDDQADAKNSSELWVKS